MGPPFCCGLDLGPLPWEKRLISTEGEVMIERDGERVIVAKAKYLSIHPKKPCTAQKDNRQKTEILGCHDVPCRHATRAIAKTSATLPSALG
jgi:hypothetical protein